MTAPVKYTVHKNDTVQIQYGRVQICRNKEQLRAMIDRANDDYVSPEVRQRHIEIFEKAIRLLDANS